MRRAMSSGSFLFSQISSVSAAQAKDAAKVLVENSIRR